jgi:hypothetical protein
VQGKGGYLENTRKIAEYKIQNSEYQNKKAVFLLDSGFWILDTALMKIGLAGYSGSGVTTLLALLSEDWIGFWNFFSQRSSRRFRWMLWSSGT